MARLVIENATVILPDRLRKKQTVVVEGRKIVSLAVAGKARRGGKTVDASGMYLAPGFIDLHVHGVHEHLIDDGPRHLEEFCRILPRYGVTGVLPCVCPRPKGKDAEFVASLAKVKSKGAAILAFHMEGPFLTLTGALPKDALGDADPQRVQALIAAARPYKALFSVAPDFKDICTLLPLMTGQGMPAFMTHTAASVEQTEAAIDAGVRHATHFYDVYPVPPEKDPGVRPCGAVEAVLADPRCSVDFILDGEHVPPVAVRMALQCKGPDRVCLITDANVGAGLAPGKYSFVGGTQIEFAYPGAPARFTKDHPTYPGALAGSGLTLDTAVRNAVKLLGVDLPQAVRMASSNPAQTIGLSARKGKVAEGYDADLVLLDDALRVKQTWIGGVCRFQA